MLLCIAIQLAAVNAREVAQVKEPQLFYHRTGATVAISPARATSKQSREVIVVSGNAKIAYRFRLASDQNVLGVDRDGQLLSTKNSVVSVARTGAVRYGPRTITEWFGDTEIDRSIAGFVVRGPGTGFVDGKLVSLLRPAPDQTFFVGIHSGLTEAIHVFSGPGLKEHVEVPLSYDGRKISIFPLDLSLAVLQRRRVCFFVRGTDISENIRSSLPSIDSSGAVDRSGVPEKILVQLDLNSGRIYPLMSLARRSIGANGSSGYDSRNLAPLGDRRILVCHGNQVYSVELQGDPTRLNDGSTGIGLSPQALGRR